MNAMKATPRPWPNSSNKSRLWRIAWIGLSLAVVGLTPGWKYMAMGTSSESAAAAASTKSTGKINPRQLQRKGDMEGEAGRLCRPLFSACVVGFFMGGGCEG